MLRVALTQRLIDCKNYPFGVLRRGPDVLVIFFITVFIVMLMLLIFHTLKHFLPEVFGNIHHAHNRNFARINRGEHGLYPFVTFSAAVNKNVALLNLHNVRRSRLKGVALLPRSKQH